MPQLYFQDTRNFLRKLTPKRIVNALKVTASYYATRWTGRPVVWGKPFTVSFEPTTACNLRCPECPSGLRQFTRPTGNLKADFFRRTMDE
ncbi:MAG: radical SAM protein, partial [Bacteroidota bacterium]